MNNQIKERATKPTTDINKVCVYSICKNESQFVERWVDSMIEADVVVVLDTGSDDNTMEEFARMQEKYPNKLIVHQEVITPWRFEVARNKARSYVPEDCNILVSTDLDEVMEPGWAQPLRDNWIEGVHERGIYKFSWSHLPNGESGRVFRYDKVHSRRWFWKYPVHELLWKPDEDNNVFTPDQTCDLFDQIHLHHYPDQTKSRGQYLPLLELRAKEDPNDYYGLIYLAHEYYYHGECQKSIDTFNRIFTDFADRCHALDRASCYLFLGDDYKTLKDYPMSIKSYMTAIEIDPTYREPYLALGSLYIEMELYDMAISIIKRGLQMSYRHYTWLERDLSWTYEPYDMLSIASFYGGYKRDSLAYATKAYLYDTTNERLHNNINLIIDNMSDAEFLA